MIERHHTKNESRATRRVFQRPIWIMALAVAFLLSNGVGILGLFDISLTTTALAKKDDKDKDKDGKKKGGGGGSGGSGSGDECNPEVDKYGLCANHGFVTIKGMTNKVWVHSTTGSIWTEVTSPDVNVDTGSGDSFTKGLTKKGKFETDTGNLKVYYCREPLGGTELKITSLSTGDVDIRFFEGTQFDFDIITSGTVKNKMGDCDSCGFKLRGQVLGNIFINEVLLEDDSKANNCLY